MREFDPAVVIYVGHGLCTGFVTDVDSDDDLDIIGQDGYSGASKPYLYKNMLR